jgi:hypothetical protein
MTFDIIQNIFHYLFTKVLNINASYIKILAIFRGYSLT